MKWCTAILTVLLATLVAPPGIPAGQGPEVRPPADPRFGQLARDRLARIRDVLQKRDRGEPLTKEEEMLLRNAAGARWRMKKGDPIDRGPDELVRGSMNVIDAAHLAIAEIEFGRGHHQQALAELQKIVAKSPDPDAVATTHFNLAVIYRRHLKDPRKAVEEYRKVTGELKERALREVEATLEEARNAEEGPDEAPEARKEGEPAPEERDGPVVPPE